MSGAARLSVRRVDGRAALLGAAAVLGALAAAPIFAESASLSLLAQIYVYVALATLWNLLAGFSGLVSVGQQAYVGLGGYALFGLTQFGGLHPLVAILAAGGLAAVAAAPVALLLFRLRGAYFAIGSWVVAETFRLLAAQTTSLGGGSGASLPARIVVAMAPGRSAREQMIYETSLALATALVAATIALLRSRWGLALRAIRDNELAARSSGVEVERAKWLVYVFAASGAAMVGALIFLQKLRISPDAAFSVNDWTANVIFMTVIGGVGRIEGPFVGALLYFALRQAFADLGGVYLMMLGVVAIAVMLKAPGGLWGLFADRFGFSLASLDRRAPISTQKTPPSAARPGDAQR